MLAKYAEQHNAKVEIIESRAHWMNSFMEGEKERKKETNKQRKKNGQMEVRKHRKE